MSCPKCEPRAQRRRWFWWGGLLMLVGAAALFEQTRSAPRNQPSPATAPAR